MGILPAPEMDLVGQDRLAGVFQGPPSTELLPISTLESRHALLTFHGLDLLEVQFKPRTVLTAVMVVELLDRIASVPEQRVKYLLIHICGLDAVDSDVPWIFNSSTEGIRIALMGAGPADRVLARFFMRKLDPSREMAYVEGRQDALEFLLRNV